MHIYIYIYIVYTVHTVLHVYMHTHMASLSSGVLSLPNKSLEASRLTLATMKQCHSSSTTSGRTIYSPGLGPLQEYRFAAELKEKSKSATLSTTIIERINDAGRLVI